jgi:hypothetical protein
MPATTYSGYGYQGMSLPQPDLLWLNAFGARYGLFVSAPLLLLALYVPGWLQRGRRLLGSAETCLVVWYTVAFFLFTAANQFSRMQFNSGIRHVVPVVPFVFLLAATILRRLPLWPAVGIGVAGTYWSWCLAMYRDVEQGVGVWEAIYHISTGGPQLPWLRTLAGLGLQPAWLSAWVVLLVAAALVWAVWSLRLPSRHSVKQPAESPIGVR